MVKTLGWYEQQNFRYFYYKNLTHHWEVDYPCGWQHAGSYYLPAIAFAAHVTGEARWQRHLAEKLALFSDPRYDIYHSFNWGSDLPILRELLGDRVSDLVAERKMLRVNHFDTPEAFREFFKACYGPTIAVYRSIADDPAKVAALDRDLAELARRHDTGADTTVMDWEYLLLTARRSG